MIETSVDFAALQAAAAVPVVPTSGYNGWKNWETFEVNRWICQEEILAEAMHEQAPFTPEEAEEFARLIFPNGTPEMDSREELDKVDWQGLAEAWSNS
jgi:hypothetical protein